MATTVAPVGGAAGGLPPGVALSEPAEAVLRSRSWRGVLRCLGSTSPSTGRRLRAVCDAVGLDHRHCSGDQHGTRDVEALRRAVAQSATWLEVADRVGYASTSGSARSAVRRHAAAAGLDVLHLTPGGRPEWSSSGPPQDRQL